MESTRELIQIFVRRFGLLHASCCDTCCGEQVSLVQSHILYEINRQSKPSMQQVAEALGIDITTFSRQIKTLENKGLVQRVPDSNDRRINTLVLTAEGQKTEKLVDEHVTKFLVKIMSQMTDFERDMVIKSIQLLNKAFLNAGKCC